MGMIRKEKDINNIAEDNTLVVKKCSPRNSTVLRRILRPDLNTPTTLSEIKKINTAAS